MEQSTNLYDLSEFTGQGGCSAKLPAAGLERVMANLPVTPHRDLLVGTDTHDDAGVLRISDDLALIQTTDFFPPVCADPFTFGCIAAANALSDVYAMGGEVLSVLNIVAWPADKPLEALREILKGGIEKVKEAGGVVMGGHTIQDDVPKYGLAVTGTIHPDRIITNAAAQPGDTLVLTKPVGTGIILAGHRIGEATGEQYAAVLESMMQLSRNAVPVMHSHGVRCATDVTGFGLAGHALKMAKASGVTLQIHPAMLPLFNGTMPLLTLGCIPGACFRNLEFTRDSLFCDLQLPYEAKMVTMDAQTSGGLLICCPPGTAATLVQEMITAGFQHTAVIGDVVDFSGTWIELLMSER
ncbi:MAG: selenide, water dikinase SelD [Bacteroidales bacterium]